MFFSNAFFSVKTNKVKGGELLLKTVGLITMLFPGPDLHCAAPLVLSRFLQHLPSVDQKCRPKIKSYHPIALRF